MCDRWRWWDGTVPLVHLTAGDEVRDREFNNNEAFLECDNGGELARISLTPLELDTIFSY